MCNCCVKDIKVSPNTDITDEDVNMLKTSKCQSRVCMVKPKTSQGADPTECHCIKTEGF